MDAETEGLAYLLTMMVWRVEPEINQAATYELILEFLANAMEDEVTEHIAMQVGTKIRATRKMDALKLH